MEAVDAEKVQACPTDGAQLNRNRSFKSKQLVRSLAIRESHSPPRTESPQNSSQLLPEKRDSFLPEKRDSFLPEKRDSFLPEKRDSSQVRPDKRDSSLPDKRDSTRVFPNKTGPKQHSVEIQITSGVEPGSPRASTRTQRERAARWLGHSCQLLSHSPLVTCVCHCTVCRGKQRDHSVPVKQDSGIACSEDCPDCPDCDHNGGEGDGARILKSASEDSALVDNYCKCPERKDRNRNLLVKSDSAEERYELSGAELVSFLKATLNKSLKDRMMLLKIEKELHLLVNDNGRCIVRFPVMSSYGRMLVHRCASLFQLTHHLDTTNKACVLVSKNGTSGGRIPCTSFQQWCTTIFPPNSQDCPPTKYILKRNSTESGDGGEAGEGGEGEGEGPPAPRAPPTLAQRERDYETLRTRIFSSQDENQWPWLSGPVKLLTPDSGKNKLLKVQSLEMGGESSRERGVSKSHSFAGYPPEQTRQLSKQGDLASSSWRLSPSSSGYKTLSLRSTDSITPSPTGGISPEPCPMTTSSGLVLALTDLSTLPPGALLLHPQTGRALTNADGTLYHYDPSNPPIMFEEQMMPPEQVDQNIDKRRGRLEKQHSFMANEYDTNIQSVNETCCNCNYEQREHDCQDISADTISNSTEQLASPSKLRYEPAPAATNQIVPPQELPANHKSSYDAIGNNMPIICDDDHRLDKVQDIDNTQYTAASYIPNYAPEIEVDPLSSQYAPELYSTPELQSVSKTPVSPQGTIPMQGVVYQTQSYGYPQRMETGGAYASPVYQPLAPSIEDQHKQMSQTDNTFRIDPSYPYPAIDTFACGTPCLDTATNHRSVYGTPVDPGVSGYPVGNMLIPQQYSLPQYQQIQWPTNIQPILTPHLPPSPHPKPLTPPNIYLTPTDIQIYPHFYNQNTMYPLIQYPYSYPQILTQNVHQVLPQNSHQVLPQRLPQNIQQTSFICPNIYPVIERQEIPSRTESRKPVTVTTEPVNEQEKTDKNTISTNKEVEKKVEQTSVGANLNPIDGAKLNPIDGAFKFNNMKEELASVPIQDDAPKNWRTEKFDKGKRNNGNGILGSYPTNNGFHRNFGRPVNDESQLTSAARAIVHSIRSIQSKTKQASADSNQGNQEQINENQSESYQPTNFQRQDNYQRPENYQRQNNYQRHDNYQRHNNYQRYDNYQNNRNRYQKLPHDKTHEDNKAQEAERNFTSNNYREREYSQARYDSSRNRTGNPVIPMQPSYRQPFVFRHITPTNTWCRRPPTTPIGSGFNTPRRPPHPDTRHPRR